MRILGQKCAFGATITHKKWSQSPQIIFIEFYSLILVGFHERITFFPFTEWKKSKNGQNADYGAHMLDQGRGRSGIPSDFTIFDLRVGFYGSETCIYV